MTAILLSVFIVLYATVGIILWQGWMLLPK